MSFSMALVLSQSSYLPVLLSVSLSHFFCISFSPLQSHQNWLSSNCCFEFCKFFDTAHRRSLRFYGWWGRLAGGGVRLADSRACEAGKDRAGGRGVEQPALGCIHQYRQHRLANFMAHILRARHVNEATVCATECVWVCACVWAHKSNEICICWQRHLVAIRRETRRVFCAVRFDVAVASSAAAAVVVADYAGFGRQCHAHTWPAGRTLERISPSDAYDRLQQLPPLPLLPLFIFISCSNCNCSTRRSPNATWTLWAGGQAERRAEFGHTAPARQSRGSSWAAAADCATQGTQP